jgi:hypothetical protein
MPAEELAQNTSICSNCRTTAVPKNVIDAPDPRQHRIVDAQLLGSEEQRRPSLLQTDGEPQCVEDLDLVASNLGCFTKPPRAVAHAVAGENGELHLFLFVSGTVASGRPQRCVWRTLSTGPLFLLHFPALRRLSPVVRPSSVDQESAPNGLPSEKHSKPHFVTVCQSQLDGPTLPQGQDIRHDHRPPAPLAATAPDVAVLQHLRFGRDRRLGRSLEGVDVEPNEDAATVHELLEVHDVEGRRAGAGVDLRLDGADPEVRQRDPLPPPDGGRTEGPHIQSRNRGQASSPFDRRFVPARRTRVHVGLWSTAARDRCDCSDDGSDFGPSPYHARCRHRCRSLDSAHAEHELTRSFLIFTRY